MLQFCSRFWKFIQKYGKVVGAIHEKKISDEAINCNNFEQFI